ncbi:ABC transporter ATP-binding protein/permease [Acetobacteraceae bacterium KSS8]|uniref:ABC transporter ATP-binding protein/permease n=1 Tax=Endosaccharibacter trunci TaxID=2812733 RepID=A0ABT1W9E3_9PROT|nr:ABC transporter ATP-binding protein/permease [Acetobacteraceae bacterium KSS8]
MAPVSARPRRSGRAVFIAVLSFLATHWRRRPALVAVVAGGMALATLTDVLTPILSGRLVDDVTRLPPGLLGAGQKRPPEALAALHDALRMLGGLAALGVCSVLGRRIGFIGITRLTVRIMSDIARSAFARVQRFSTDWHANTFAGSTVRRITRGMWAVDQLDDTLLLMLLPSVLVLAGTTVVLAFRWPMMGLILGLGSVGFAALSIGMTLFYVAPSARLANQWDTRVGAALADSVTCNAVVKAFGAEGREDARLDRVLRRWSSRTTRTWLRGTDSGNLQNFALTVLRLSLIAAVLWLWWRGRAGAGDVAYVLTMMFLVQGYLRDIGQQISTVQRSVNEMEEMVALYDQPLGVQDRPGAGAIRIGHGTIRFEHVRFRYEGPARPLYDDLDLLIPAGSRVGLVGPSGSGKTTLTKLLQRLYDVSGGRILIDGQDIAVVTQESLRAQIALVPQEPVLFHRSLAENIAYGRPSASLPEIREAARLANALDFIERLPGGFNTLVGERGVKLSGGERQRIAIARAFLADARVLILDEATSSLDSESEALVQEAMGRLMQDRTVIVIAHRLSTVVSLDRILVFEHGRVVEDGAHEALLEQPDGLYRRLYERQSLGLAAE